MECHGASIYLDTLPITTLRLRAPCIESGSMRTDTLTPQQNEGLWGHMAQGNSVYNFHTNQRN